MAVAHRFVVVFHLLKAEPGYVAWKVAGGTDSLAFHGLLNRSRFTHAERRDFWVVCLSGHGCLFSDVVPLHCLSFDLPLPPLNG